MVISDNRRHKGNFNLVLNCLNILKEAGVERRSIHFTVNRTNIGDILQLPYFLQQINVPNVVIGIIKPTGRALEHPEILIEPQLVLLVKERIRTISANKFLNICQYTENNWQGLGCPAGNTKCGITAEGKITSCVFLGKEYEGGNIKISSLEYLWNNDAALNTLRTLHGNETCANCPILLQCSGGCRARAIYFNKDINASDPYCCEIKKIFP
ncbi:MAG: SPASM domain-containing protein [Elusimicrobiota bacterium]